MTTRPANEASLDIRRWVNAPTDRVYAAWTDPAQLKQWVGPANVTTRNLSADPRVGGRYQWDLTSPDGEEMTVSGEYRELIPGKKIVFTWQWHDDDAWVDRSSIVTVELTERDGGTEIQFRHELLPSEDSRDRHTEGWNSVLDRLEEFFKR